MPATCFSGLPRSAGVMAQRCCLSLQPLSEAWCDTARAESVAADLYALVG